MHAASNVRFKVVHSNKVEKSIERTLASTGILTTGGLGGTSTSTRNPSRSPKNSRKKTKKSPRGQKGSQKHPQSHQRQNKQKTSPRNQASMSSGTMIPVLDPTSSRNNIHHGLVKPGKTEQLSVSHHLDHKGLTNTLNSSTVLESTGPPSATAENLVVRHNTPVVTEVVYAEDSGAPLTADAMLVQWQDDVEEQQEDDKHAAEESENEDEVDPQEQELHSGQNQELEESEDGDQDNEVEDTQKVTRPVSRASRSSKGSQPSRGVSRTSMHSIQSEGQASIDEHMMNMWPEAIDSGDVVRSKKPAEDGKNKPRKQANVVRTSTTVHHRSKSSTQPNELTTVSLHAGELSRHIREQEKKYNRERRHNRNGDHDDNDEVPHFDPVPEDPVEMALQVRTLDSRYPTTNDGTWKKMKRRFSTDSESSEIAIGAGLNELPTYSPSLVSIHESKDIGHFAPLSPRGVVGHQSPALDRPRSRAKRAQSQMSIRNGSVSGGSSSVMANSPRVAHHTPMERISETPTEGDVAAVQEFIRKHKEKSEQTLTPGALQALYAVQHDMNNWEYDDGYFVPSQRADSVVTPNTLFQSTVQLVEKAKRLEEQKKKQLERIQHTVEVPKIPGRMSKTKIPNEFHRYTNYPVRPSDTVQSLAKKGIVQIKGKGFQQRWFPSEKPANSRVEVAQLEKTLDEMLERVRSGNLTDSMIDQITSERQVYDVVLHELLRQVTYSCQERGELLERVCNEYVTIGSKDLPVIAAREKRRKQAARERIQQLQNALDQVTAERDQLVREIEEATNVVEALQEDNKSLRNVLNITQENTLYQQQRYQTTSQEMDQDQQGERQFDNVGVSVGNQRIPTNQERQMATLRKQLWEGVSTEEKETFDPEVGMPSMPEWYRKVGQELGGKQQQQQQEQEQGNDKESKAPAKLVVRIASPSGEQSQVEDVDKLVGPVNRPRLHKKKVGVVRTAQDEDAIVKEAAQRRKSLTQGVKPRRRSKKKSAIPLSKRVGMPSPRPKWMDLKAEVDDDDDNDSIFDEDFFNEM